MDANLTKKLYDACKHAFEWHCGSGSEQSEIDLMLVLQEAIDAYNEGE